MRIVIKSTFLITALSLLLGTQVMAQHRRAIDKSTDVLALLPSLTGATVALCEKDYQGLKQLALSSVSSLAVNYILELSITKNRPDGSGHHAFPSTHAALSFDGAAYLQRRYGWKWGIPAYLTAAYVGWGRVYAKKHDIWDVLAGAAIGAGSAYVFTRPLAKKGKLVLAPIAIDDSPGIYLSASF